MAAVTFASTGVVFSATLTRALPAAIAVHVTMLFATNWLPFLTRLNLLGEQATAKAAVEFAGIFCAVKMASIAVRDEV